MTPIVCISGVELLMEYLEGALPAELSAAINSHVAGCERCAAFVASYCATPRILRDAMGAAPVPADVEASLKAFLRASTGAFRSR
jgi:anti-sigma factor RsiW